MLIHSYQAGKIATFQWDKSPIKIAFKYKDYPNVFFPNLAIELLKNTDMNDYAIKLMKDKQLPYRPIYALILVELETLKTYIKIY